MEEIVERVIIDAQKLQIDNETIRKLLYNNIYGIDIDKKAIEITKSKLDNVCIKYNIIPPNWDNIKTTNALSKIIIKSLSNKFDFVFGNPPYVRIQNLKKSTITIMPTRLYRSLYCIF